MKPIVLVVGADEAAVSYKEELKKVLSGDPRVAKLVDVGLIPGEDSPYPEIAIAAAELIANGEADRGLVLCGTGLGVAIAANKVPGIRAVTAHDSYSVERSVKSNNAQILCMGQRVVGLELAKKLVNEWLDCVFDDSSPSASKVALISDYEQTRVGGTCD